MLHAVVTRVSSSVEPDPRFDGRGKGNEDMILYHDGNATWLPVVKVRVPCTVDMKYFPYDTQQCHLKFGSWAHTEARVNLVSSTGSNVITDTSTVYDCMT